MGGNRNVVGDTELGSYFVADAAVLPQGQFHCRIHPNPHLVDLIGAQQVGSDNPRAECATDQFEQSIMKFGLRGIKLSATDQAHDPRSPEYWQLYEIAAHHRVPVLMYCGGVCKGSLEWADPSLLDKVALPFRDLKQIVARFGQPYLEQTAF